MRVLFLLSYQHRRGSRLPPGLLEQRGSCRLGSLPRRRYAGRHRSNSMSHDPHLRFSDDITRGRHRGDAESVRAYET